MQSSDILNTPPYKEKYRSMPVALRAAIAVTAFSGLVVSGFEVYQQAFQNSHDAQVASYQHTQEGAGPVQLDPLNPQ